MFDLPPVNIDAEEAFRLILGVGFELNKPMCSPIREDKNPSFMVRVSNTGSVYYIDYGTGETGGWFDLYKQLYGGNYAQAVRRLGKEIPSISSKSTIKCTSKQDKFNFRLDVNHIPWSNHMLYYWRQYGISYYTLRYFDVHCISSYKLMDYPTKYVYGYSYEFGDNKRKILIPKAYKSNKWRTNTDKIQGHNQLDLTQDRVIITKSLKDIMMLYELGYTSVSPQAESDLMPEEYMQFLHNNFSEIVILFDNDKAGKIAVDKHIEKYSYIKPVFIPDNLGKDISEVSKNLGINKASETMKSILQF